MMSSLQQWIEVNYNDLVKNYAAHWVLIRANQVIFSDKSFEIVYKQAEKLQLSQNECVIEFIDSGDTVFYEITIFDTKD